MPLINAEQARDAQTLHSLVTYVTFPCCFLACKTCGIAISLNRVPSHFSASPHGYARRDCGRILSAWKTVYLPTHPLTIQTEDDLRDWEPPSKPVHPCPALPVHYAFHCKYPSKENESRRCTFINRTKWDMQKHCREAHGWKNPVSAGRPRLCPEKRRPTEPWEVGVPAQRLTSPGRGSHLWRVHGPQGEIAPAGTLRKPVPALQYLFSERQDRSLGESLDRDLDSNNGEQGLDPWARLEKQLDEHSASTVISSNTTTQYPIHLSPWLRKTGWAEYLSGNNLDAVADLLSPPCPYKDSGLAMLLQAFNELVEDARASILSEKVNIFALHRANSFVPGRHFKRPLLSKLQDRTYRTYKLVWQKLLCFVYRLVVLRQPPRLQYVLTEAQLAAISRMPCSNTSPKTVPWDTRFASPPSLPSPPLPSTPALPRPRQHIPRSCRQRKPNLVLSEDEDDKSNNCDYEPEPEQARFSLSAPSDRPYTCPQQPGPPSPGLVRAPSSPVLVGQQGPCDPDLKAACLEFCISLLDHKLHGKLTESIMVGFLAAHGIDRNKQGFKEAVAYTSDLSALVKIAQLMVVHYAVKLAALPTPTNWWPNFKTGSCALAVKRQ